MDSRNTQHHAGTPARDKSHPSSFIYIQQIISQIEVLNHETTKSGKKKMENYYRLLRLIGEGLLVGICLLDFGCPFFPLNACYGLLATGYQYWG